MVATTAVSEELICVITMADISISEGTWTAESYSDIVLRSNPGPSATQKFFQSEAHKDASASPACVRT